MGQTESKERRKRKFHSAEDEEWPLPEDGAPATKRVRLEQGFAAFRTPSSRLSSHSSSFSFAGSPSARLPLRSSASSSGSVGGGGTEAAASRMAVAATEPRRKRKERQRRTTAHNNKEEHVVEAVLDQGVRKSASIGSLTGANYPSACFQQAFLPEFPLRSPLGDQLEFLDLIGDGAFGRVHLVAQNSRLFAVKEQSKSSIITRGAVLQARREVQILTTLVPHDFVARFFGAWQSKRHVFVLLERVSGGTLLALCEKHNGKIPERVLVVYAAEILLALEFLHSSLVIFRDLKLDNVGIDHFGHAKLVDFGMAKRLPENSAAATGTICGTLQYMAPEVARLEPYGFWVDFWSLGVLLYAAHQGHFPFRNAQDPPRSHTDLIYANFSAPRSCSRHFSNLLCHLLDMDLSSRLIDFDQVQSHPLFYCIPSWAPVELRKLDLRSLLTESHHHGCRSIVDFFEDETRSVDAPTFDEDAGYWRHFDETSTTVSAADWI